jgi:hypothetical protein
VCLKKKVAALTRAALTLPTERENRASKIVRAVLTDVAAVQGPQVADRFTLLRDNI